MWFYPVSRRELLDEIKPGWRKQALQKTRENRRQRALVHSSNTWSKIKDVYLTRQSHKCIFCEMKILIRGKANSDVEHFRPKGKVAQWPKAGAPQYPFPTGGGQATGYYWLAYDPFNYAASCKHCNSALKQYTFPILGARGLAHASIAKLNAQEQPLLLFPFGPWGDNPANYFEFNHVLMVPKAGIGDIARQRAEVTIRFFDLNDEKFVLPERHNKVVLLFELYQALLGVGGMNPGNGGLALSIMLDSGSSQAFFAHSYFGSLRSVDATVQRRARDDYFLSQAYHRTKGIRPVVVA